MEIHTRKHHTIQDQENAYANKGKKNVVMPQKRQNVVLRALGDVNINIQVPCDVPVGKVATAAAEIEKKASLNRAPLRSNYKHVQSKVDTGLAVRPVQHTTRAPLRREESTGVMARAATRPKTALRETQEKVPKPKTSSTQIKRSTEGTKKTTKLAPVTEQPEKKMVKSLKPILKESTESLGKLYLTEKVKDENIINLSLSPVRLPADIEDIDAADKASPLLMSIYIKDIYKYLTELELRYPVEEDHLRKQVSINERMRATLIDWLVEVHCQFDLVPETFQITVGIVDRYLQMVSNINRDRLQLIGVAAMYIASKYEEIYAPNVGDFVYVTDHAYTKENVFQCEREILSKLGFCLARPIPLSFLRRFTKASKGTSKHHHLAKYFIDLCLVEYSMAHYRPSELAAASLCLSLYLLSSKKFEELWTPTLAYYSQYNLQHLEPIVKKIAKIVVGVGKSKYKAVYKKYLDQRLAKVSALPQLKGDAIYELIQSHSLGSLQCSTVHSNSNC